MEERSKEEILSDLYAIRAAMSLVSQKTDVTRREERRIASSNDKIKSSDIAIVEHRAESMREAEKQYGVATRLREIEEKIKILSDKIKNEMDEESRAEKNLQRSVVRYKEERFPISAFWKFLGIGFAITIAVISFFGMLIARLINSAFGVDEGPSFGIMVGICLFVWIFSTVLYVVIKNKNVEKGVSEMRIKGESESFKHKNIISKTNAEMALLEQQKKQLLLLQRKGEIYFDDEAVEKMREAQRQYAASIAPSKKAETQAIAVSQSKITELAKESQEIINNAQKLYPVIDFRDWENVDLIIFYYETGRADTMKEALQLVDRTRQTEILIEAVGRATKMISKTIRQSVGALEQTLDNSFRKLSVQLEFQHQESLEENARLGEKLEAQNERLAKLNEQTEELRLSAEAQARVQAANQAMTNALLAKINVSSTQLAQDMDKQMKLVHHIPV